MPSQERDKMIYPLADIQGCTAEIWEWIRNSIPHFISDVITNPCWHLSIKELTDFTLDQQKKHLISFHL